MKLHTRALVLLLLFVGFDFAVGPRGPVAGPIWGRVRSKPRFNVAGPSTCQSTPPYGPVVTDISARLKFVQLSSSDMSDPYHPSETPTTSPYNYRPLTPGEQAQDKMIGQTISSPSFEATRKQWEAALGMPITMLGGMEMPDGSYKFVVGVNAAGNPIPDVLPHNFMGVPVVVEDTPPFQNF